VNFHIDDDRYCSDTRRIIIETPLMQQRTDTHVRILSFIAQLLQKSGFPQKHHPAVNSKIIK